MAFHRSGQSSSLLESHVPALVIAYLGVAVRARRPHVSRRDGGGPLGYNRVNASIVTSSPAGVSPVYAFT